MEKREVEQRIERFQSVCRKAGVKVTHQRLEIFREVAQSGDHPDAEMVYDGVRKRLSTISLDTVYRALWLLSDLGLIVTMGPGPKRARFDGNLSRHHHFVCVRCGLTRDFYSEGLNQLDIPEAAQVFGSVETTHVEVRGVCLECARNEKEEDET